jgi:hypothetical protein
LWNLDFQKRHESKKGDYLGKERGPRGGKRGEERIVR